MSHFQTQSVPVSSNALASTVLSLIVATALSPWASAEELRFPEGLKYGEWCGIDHPRDPEREPPPIDEIDAACRTHDFAYDAREPWGNSDADQELIDKMLELLERDRLWNRTPNGEKREASLSSEQFRVASTITSWMSVQSIATLYSDIVNGKLSSVVKFTTSSGEVAIVVPTKVAAELVRAPAEKLSEVTGLPVDDVLNSSEKLVIRSTLEVGDFLDGAVDETGDVTEVLVDAIGETTGLDKPVGELGEELRLAITHPKKAVKRVRERVKDCVRLRIRDCFS